MMNFALVYLGQRFFIRLAEWLRHWYGKSFFIAGHQALNILEKLDRRLALRITLRYFFQPLYQDYTVLGYILGFIFRSGRIVLASVIYAGLILVFLAGYFIWLAVPPYLIFKILSGE